MSPTTMADVASLAVDATTTRRTHPDRDRVILLHAPCHAPTVTRTDIGRALGMGACVVNFTEAYRYAGSYLATRRAYRRTVGWSPVDTRGVRSPQGDAGDNPVMTHRGHRLIAGHAIRTTPAGTGKLDPERWLHGIVLDHPAMSDPVESWNAHPNPVQAGGWSPTIHMLGERLDRAQNRGRVVMGSGDLQVGSTHRELRAMFGGLGLRVWVVGVDWIWWDPARVKVVDRAQVDGHQDHPWLRIEFRPVR